MPGQVIRVERRPRSSGLGQLYPRWAQDLLRATRQLLRNRSRGSLLDRGRAGAGLGMPVLVERPDGRPRCVACGLCAFACPGNCIRLEAGERDDGTDERFAVSFDLDLSRCISCALCEEACPEEAIVMSDIVAVAVTEPDALHFGLAELLVPAEAVAARLAFLRAGYVRPSDPCDSEGVQP